MSGPPPGKVWQAGDPRRDSPEGWTLLPVDTSNGECSQCGQVHEPELPHDAHSLYYQYAFYAEHGRFPTWLDAMAHCSQEMQDFWVQALRERGIEP